MPAVLRPGTGERHALGRGPLDPRTSYGTTMPTYDETISTHPTPGTNDFG
ncbi:hypothetical protein [Streptomyces chartreusis]